MFRLLASTTGSPDLGEMFALNFELQLLLQGIRYSQFGVSKNDGYWRKKPIDDF
jgi:hypothetical protein